MPYSAWRTRTAPPHDTLAYAIGKRKVATIGKKKDRTDKTHGTTDIKPAKKQYHANDHPQRDQRMCQTDTQREEKEHRLLQKNRMVDSQPIASHLRKHADALGRIGHA